VAAAARAFTFVSTATPRRPGSGNCLDPWRPEVQCVIGSLSTYRRLLGQPDRRVRAHCAARALRSAQAAVKSGCYDPLGIAETPCVLLRLDRGWVLPSPIALLLIGPVNGEERLVTCLAPSRLGVRRCRRDQVSPPGSAQPHCPSEQPHGEHRGGGSGREESPKPLSPPRVRIVSSSVRACGSVAIIRRTRRVWDFVTSGLGAQSDGRRLFGLHGPGCN
jgi:hypothetical protein